MGSSSSARAWTLHIFHEWISYEAMARRDPANNADVQKDFLDIDVERDLIAVHGYPNWVSAVRQTPLPSARHDSES